MKYIVAYCLRCMKVLAYTKLFKKCCIKKIPYTKRIWDFSLYFAFFCDDYKKYAVKDDSALKLKSVPFKMYFVGDIIFDL